MSLPNDQRSYPKKAPLFAVSSGNDLNDKILDEIDFDRHEKLVKNRQSAFKSRKKRKAIFESLRSDIETVTTERDNMRLQLNNNIDMLKNAYEENKRLRLQMENILDENSRLKDTIIEIQDTLNYMSDSMSYTTKAMLPNIMYSMARPTGNI